MGLAYGFYMEKSMKFLFLLIFSSSTVVAQQKLTPDHFMLNECNLAFKQPEGYRYFETESHIFLPLVDKGGMGILEYLINTNNDIMIGVAAIPFLEADDDELRLRVALTNGANNNNDATTESVHPNNNWKSIIKAFADPLKVADFKFDDLMSLNADTVVVFQVRMEQPHLGKYDKCKCLIMNKDYAGVGRLLYFYNDQNGHLVDVEIRRTWGTLVFRPDSLDNPAWRKKLGARK